MQNYCRPHGLIRSYVKLSKTNIFHFSPLLSGQLCKNVRSVFDFNLETRREKQILAILTAKPTGIFAFNFLEPLLYHSFLNWSLIEAERLEEDSFRKETLIIQQKRMNYVVSEKIYLLCRFPFYPQRRATEEMDSFIFVNPSCQTTFSEL